MSHVSRVQRRALSGPTAQLWSNESQTYLNNGRGYLRLNPRQQNCFIYFRNIRKHLLDIHFGLYNSRIFIKHDNQFLNEIKHFLNTNKSSYWNGRRHREAIVDRKNSLKLFSYTFITAKFTFILFCLLFFCSIL